MSSDYAPLLDRLPETLRQMAYRDAEFCSRAGIVTVSHITFRGTFRFDRNAFSSAAQTAIDSGLPQDLLTDTGIPARLRAVGGPRSHLLVTDGTHTTGLRRWELLSRDPGKRRAVLRRMLRLYNLPSADRQCWQRLCGTRPLTGDELDALIADLLDTPDGPRIALRRLSRQNQISLDELVPDSLRYYERLVGKEFDPVNMPPTVEKVQRLALSRKLSSSLPLILTTAASPALCPTWIISSCSADEVLSALSRAAKLSDPYSLAAAFELAVLSSKSDARAGNVALTIATNLLSDKALLTSKCRLFSAMLIATSAGIARNPALRDRDAAWRRLASFSHSVLAHRALFTPGLDSELFLTEIASRLGASFYLAALLDKPQLPLWRPLWLQPACIEADLIGRFENALRSMPPLPEISRIEHFVATARSALNGDVPPLASMFPSFLEGYWPDSEERAAPAQVNQDILDAFASKSQAEACTIIGNVAAVYRPRDAAMPLYATALANFPTPATPSDWTVFLSRLSAASHAAGVTRSPHLAETVADTLLRALRCSTIQPPTFEFIAIFFEAAAAHATPSDARVWLGERLRRLSSVAPVGQLLTELRNIIDQQSYMRPALGRAFAAARATIALGS